MPEKNIKCQETYPPREKKLIENFANICKIENLLQIISFFFFWSWKFAKFQQPKTKGKLFPMYNIGTNIIYLYQTFCPTLFPYIYSLIHPHDKYEENDKLETPTLNPKILWLYPYRDWQFSIAIKKVNIVSVITHWWAAHNTHGSCCPSPNSQGTLPQLPWDFIFSWFIFIDFFTVYLRLVIKTNIAWELTKSIRSQLHWQNTFQNSRRCLCFFHPYTIFVI